MMIKVLFLYLFSNFVFAQYDTDKLINKMLESQRQMIEQFFGKGTDFGSDIKSLRDQFLRADPLYKNEGQKDYEWKKENGGYLLVIKFTQDQKTPLEFKIEKGILNVSGKTVYQTKETGGQVRSYTKYVRNINIDIKLRSDIDQNNPKYELDDKTGFTKIFFKLKKASIKKIPISPSKKDKVI